MAVTTDKLADDIMDKIKEAFDTFNLDGSADGLDMEELGNALSHAGEKLASYQLRDLQAKMRQDMEQFDKDNNHKLSFLEFVEVYKSISKKSSVLQNLVKNKVEVKKKEGQSAQTVAGVQHSHTDNEIMAFKDWVNTTLEDDTFLHEKKYLPIQGVSDMFEKMRDGIILCKMINRSVEDTIDERAINKPKQEMGDMAITKVMENNILVVNSAKAIGCIVVNIGQEDISGCKEHLVLGLLWQIIRVGLFSHINFTNHPELACLLRDGETMDDLLKLSPEELLMRWANYQLEKERQHIQKSCSDGTYECADQDNPLMPIDIKNFSGEIKDSQAYAFLLNQLARHSANEVPQDAFDIQESLAGKLDSAEKMLMSENKTTRATMVLKNADVLGCKKFVEAIDITRGNSKLNIAFVANLFNHYPCMDEVDDVNPYIENREMLTYRNWMNSCGVNPPVYHLWNDLKDGLVLLKMYNVIAAETVNMDKVNKRPFVGPKAPPKKLENCNKVIEVGQQQRKYNIVGFGGKDIRDCSAPSQETLILGLLAQMLRDYTVSQLDSLAKMLKLEAGSSGKSISDAQIIKWANDKLKEADCKEKCGLQSVKSYRDKSLRNSLAVIDLIEAIVPGMIDYQFVHLNPEVIDEDVEVTSKVVLEEGEDNDAAVKRVVAGLPQETVDEIVLRRRLENAKYAITLCRKVGAMPYALPLDLVEVNKNMVSTIFACLMHLDLSKQVPVAE